MRQLTKAIATALIAWACSYANAANLDVRGGILFGATDVLVNGLAYDVAFVDGTCADVYSGCDEVADFPFISATRSDTLALGVAALTALSDQVFVDSPLGAFDSDPTLTNGCRFFSQCFIMIPRSVSLALNSLEVQFFRNDDLEARDAPTGLGGLLRSLDLSQGSPDGNVYAVWTSAVPEPASSAMFAAGLAAIGLHRRRARRQSKRTQPLEA